MKGIRILGIFVGVFFLCLTGNSDAESTKTPGVTDTKIIVGGTGPYTGPAAEYPAQFKRGIDLYFKKINVEEGGIYGRKLHYIGEDDVMMVQRSVAAFKKLAERDKVFAMLANAGSANVVAQFPLVEEYQIALVGPYAGTSQVTNPPKKRVFTTMTNWLDQARIGVDYAIDELGLSNPKIAVTGWDDETGYDTLKGANKQLKIRGKKEAIHIFCSRSAADLSSTVLKLKRKNPDIVFASGNIRIGAQLMKEAYKIGWKPYWMFSSAFVDNNMIKLAEKAATYGKGFIGVNVFENEAGNSSAAIAFRKAKAKYAPKTKISPFYFWAYASADVFVKGLRVAGKDLTREKFVQALASLNDYENGILPKFSYGPNRTGPVGGYLVKIEDGKFKKLTDWRYPKEK